MEKIRGKKGINILHLLRETVSSVKEALQTWSSKNSNEQSNDLKELIKDDDELLVTLQKSLGNVSEMAKVLGDNEEKTKKVIKRSQQSENGKVSMESRSWAIENVDNSKRMSKEEPDDTLDWNVQEPNEDENIR